MAYENSFQQLTRSLSKQKDGTSSLYRRYAKRPTNSDGSGNGWRYALLDGIGGGEKSRGTVYKNG